MLYLEEVLEVFFSIFKFDEGIVALSHLVVLITFFPFLNNFQVWASQMRTRKYFLPFSGRIKSLLAHTHRSLS